MSNAEPTVVGGRYQLGELLGRGGMAEVRKGVDLRLGRAVAVKRLRTDLATDATFQARFRREAQSSAALNHPSIVAVYDTGEELATDGSDVAQPYIVMEYVEGRTLRDILREGRKILPERALEITSSVLAALDYSHRAGIIHRDIKPGNVMLTPTGDVKVMDFGIARAVSDSASTMTQTAAVVGTAQYLSPEQARGETVDSRSDVYSAGCLLYELLTGRPPFVGDSPVAVAYQHVREPAQPPSDHDTELPPEIDAIVMKALAKRVEDRYQSAAAMRNDIERYLAGRPVQAPAVPIAPTSMIGEYDDAARATAVTELEEPEEEPRKRRIGWWIAGLVLVAALAAAAAFALPKFLGGEEEPTEVRVPDLTGQTEAQARKAITDADLKVGTVTPETSDTVKKGLVLDQDPKADDYVEPGTTIDFTVSAGKPTVTMPSVTGMTRQAAARMLRSAPYNFEVIQQEKDSDEPAGQVIETDPAPGKSVAEGTTVTIYYSDGPALVPNVVGRQEKVAEQLLHAAGFTNVKVIYDSSETDEPTGTVLEQTPAADSPLAADGQIVLIVTSYVEPSESPSPPTESPSGSPSQSASDEP
ncbi:MAG: Stk1 family PASTA domain-containing Ser/Thr kinase [Nocardioides sp.]|uniref:Stk1 family PASTA domain-containing Ser/Thr kinase n=1 Tax=Nocardioides sp. TaxID=35761 RepID=UPI0039E6E8E9